MAKPNTPQNKNEELDLTSPEGQAQAKEKLATLTTLEKSNMELKTNLETSNKKIAEQEELISSPEFLQALAGVTKPKEGETKLTSTEPEIDWNNIDMKTASTKIMESVVSKVSSVIDDKLKGVTGTVNAMKAKDVADVWVSQIESAKAKHPDFMDFKDKMIELSKEVPNITAEYAYRLAKLESVEKKSEEEKAKIPPPSKPGVPATEEKDLDPKAAAEKAFAEVQERHASKT